MVLMPLSTKKRTDHPMRTSSVAYCTLLRLRDQHSAKRKYFSSLAMPCYAVTLT